MNELSIFGITKQDDSNRDDAESRPQTRYLPSASGNRPRRSVLKTIGAGLGTATLGSTPVHSETGSDYPLVLENAESQDLSRYSGEFDWTADKGGDGYWDITTDTDDPHGAVLNGNASIKGYQAAHGGYHTIVTLDQTTKRGQSFRAKVYHPHRQTYTGLLFGVQSTDHPYPCYRLRVDNGGGPEVALEKIPPGGPIEAHNLPNGCILAEIESELHADTVYTVEWEWNEDGAIPFTVYNPDRSVLIDEPAPEPDTEYACGGFGFMVSKSNPNADDMTSIVDDFVITASDGNTERNSTPSTLDDGTPVAKSHTANTETDAPPAESDATESTPTTGRGSGFGRVTILVAVMLSLVYWLLRRPGAR